MPSVGVSCLTGAPVSYQPSPEVDRSAFGLKITRNAFPVGVAGVRMSLTEIARRIRDGGRAPSVRAFGEFVVRNAGHSASETLDAMQYAEIFLDYIHQNVRYSPDPVLTEFVQAAECTLCTPGAPMCIPVGDCDDLLVALGSLLQAQGVPVRIVKQTFGAEDQEHVLVQFQTEGGDWVYADPSVKDKPLGWHAPASEEVMIDPNDPSAIGMVGAPDAEFIGVGRPPVTRPLGAPTRRLGMSDEPIDFAARPWPWRGIGDAAPAVPDVFVQSSADLATMNQVILAGDSGIVGGNDPSGAVASYQAAGQQGQNIIGPEIVNASAAASTITNPIVQQAAQLNQTLQALSVASATQTTAQTAQGLVKQMAALYAQAVTAGQATLAGDGGLTMTQKIFLAVAAGAALGSGWAYYQHSKGSPAKPAVKKLRRHPHRRLAHRRR
jgi:hypothetical protein